MTINKGDLQAGSGSNNQFGILPAGTNGQTIVYDDTSPTGLKATSSIGSMVGSQTLFVDKNGNDTTGDGSPQFPFLTITHAITVAVSMTPSSSNRICIQVMSGDWADNFALPANICICGCSTLCTNLTGNITINDTSWNGGADNRGSLERLRIIGTLSLDFTFGAGSTAGKFYLYDLREPASGVVITAFNGSLNQIEIIASHAFGNVTLNGGTLNCEGVEFDGTVTVNDTALATASATFRNCTLPSATATVAHGGVSLGLLASTLSGSLTTTGAVAITTSGLPPTSTLSGTTTITYVTGCKGFGYTPGAPAQWVAAAPTNIQQALDRIAAVVSVGGVTPIP